MTLLSGQGMGIFHSPGDSEFQMFTGYTFSPGVLLMASSAVYCLVAALLDLSGFYSLVIVVDSALALSWLQSSELFPSLYFQAPLYLFTFSPSVTLSNSSSLPNDIAGIIWPQGPEFSASWWFSQLLALVIRSPSHRRLWNSRQSFTATALILNIGDSWDFWKITYVK